MEGLKDMGAGQQPGNTWQERIDAEVYEQDQIDKELISLRKIEAAAKALITWPTGKMFFSEYWDKLLEALEQK